MVIGKKKAFQVKKQTKALTELEALFRDNPGWKRVNLCVLHGSSHYFLYTGIIRERMQMSKHKLLDLWVANMRKRNEKQTWHNMNSFEADIGAEQGPRSCALLQPEATCAGGLPPFMHTQWPFMGVVLPFIGANALVHLWRRC